MLLQGQYIQNKEGKMAKRYTIYKINAKGTRMIPVRSGSLSEMRGYCSKRYSKHKSKGRVYWLDGFYNKYTIHSSRPIFVPNK